MGLKKVRRREMFLNKTMFKKWIKDAFNHGGLTVGYIYDGLVMSGSTWVVWVDEGSIPNWVKAAVMEYTGELPKLGCVFKAEKDSPIQYEISENAFLNLPERFMEAKTPFTVTPVVYAANWNSYRIMQCRHTNRLIAVSEDLYGIIDLKDLENESAPIGPSARNEQGDIMLWKNDSSALAICSSKLGDDGNRVLDALERIDFRKEDK